MTNEILIVSKLARGREKLDEIADRNKGDIVERSASHIMLEDGTRVEVKTAEASVLRGRRPDIVVLCEDISEEVFYELIVPMSHEGIIIDNR